MIYGANAGGWSLARLFRLRQLRALCEEGQHDGLGHGSNPQSSSGEAMEQAIHAVANSR